MNDWIERARAMAVFVKDVGVPVVFFLVIMGITIGIVFGWIPNPFVSAREFEEHRKNNEQMHQDLIKNHTESLREHQDQTTVLKAIRCGVIRATGQREQCYEKLSVPETYH